MAYLRQCLIQVRTASGELDAANLMPKDSGPWEDPQASQAYFAFYQLAEHCLQVGINPQLNDLVPYIASHARD